LDGGQSTAGDISSAEAFLTSGMNLMGSIGTYRFTTTTSPVPTQGAVPMGFALFSEVMATWGLGYNSLFLKGENLFIKVRDF
jgi:hypothetical protein